MGIAFLHGNGGSGGGAGLNFKVVGNPQPASASENTIWIDTDTEITSWIFSATEPDTPSEGMVWIATGTAAPVAFNALKKNGIMVYPMSAKQYIDGVWVTKTAKSYRNGALVDWITYFYKDGNTFDDITGGYVYGGGTTLEADSIKIYLERQNHESYAITDNKIDFSNISTLYVKGRIAVRNSYNEHSNVYLYVTDNKITSVTGDVGDGATIIKECKATNAGTPDIYNEIVLSLDVSGLTGSKYIFIAAKNLYKYTYTTFYTTEIRGE